jgi:AcrR family transcriptional regulator
LHDNVRRALDAPTGNRERIRASFRAYFDFVDEHAEGFRLMMQETVGAEDDFRQHVEAFRALILSDVADLIERESTHRLDRVHAETVALGLIGMVENVARRELGSGAEARQAALETLVQLAWRGITGLGS